MKVVFEPLEPTRYVASKQKEIDTQQLEFIETGNKYINAYNKRKHFLLVEPTILFLSDYTRKHFLTQEAYMEMYSYPDIENHIEEHQKYLKDIAKGLKSLLVFKGCDDNSAYETIAAMTGRLITDWFEQHIMHADLRFNEFIRFEK